MNIGQAAKLSRLNDKTVRYYEHINLVALTKRNPNGYREYDQTALSELKFVASARQAGFTINECVIPPKNSRLFRDQNRHSKHVKSFVLEKIDTIDDQIKTLQDMRATLSDLAARCHGDEGAKCAIIEGLPDSFGKQS